MALFTCILEFDGGTYIWQFRTTSPDRAVAKYALHVLHHDSVSTFPIRRRLSEALGAEKPVAIDGVRNVWCCSTSVGKKFALLNVIATVSQ
jgi:hypothetical protein